MLCNMVMRSTNWCKYNFMNIYSCLFIGTYHRDIDPVLCLNHPLLEEVKKKMWGQHLYLAVTVRSSSHPKTNKYWGFVWLFLALITNYIGLYSWKLVKILGIFFAPHFGCSTTGNFRAKLQFLRHKNLQLIGTHIFWDKCNLPLKWPSDYLAGPCFNNF